MSSDLYLTILPNKIEIKDEIKQRASCSNFQKYSTTCDETFRRLGDWCSGCLFKAILDTFYKSGEEKVKS